MIHVTVQKIGKAQKFFITYTVVSPNYSHVKQDVGLCFTTIKINYSN